MIRRTLSGVYWSALLLLFSPLVWSQQVVGIAHFAPGVGKVQFLADGADLGSALDYGEHVPELLVPVGSRLITALDVSGNLIAESTVDVGVYSLTVVLAPSRQGTEPQVLVVDDDNDLLREGRFGFALVNLARPGGIADPGVDRLLCPPFPPTAMAVPFTLGVRGGAGSFSGDADAGPERCLLQINYPGLDSPLQARVEGESGSRVLIVVSGDNLLEPVELKVLTTRRNLPTVLGTVDDRINGLYVAPDMPGLVVQLAVDPGPLSEIRAVISGLSPDGLSWWGLGDGRDFVVYRRGSPDGAPPAFPIGGGFAIVTMFSCERGVLRLAAESLGTPPGLGSAREIEILKVLPQGQCRGEGR